MEHRNFTDKEEFSKERYEVLNDWAYNVIQRWIKEMRTQHVSPFNENYTGGDLARSFYYKIYNASGGDQTKILFVLNNYGHFVDMGVGEGQKYNFDRMAAPFRSGQRYATGEKGQRVVKPYLMPVFKQRVYSLAKIMERVWADNARLMLFQTLTAEQFGINSENNKS
ncbi:MAG: hypothetical protein LBQ65_02005 [Tannerellaceae bacterium]|nr:hypothetical protein [Tannerellaceae bacterium]